MSILKLRSLPVNKLCQPIQMHNMIPPAFAFHRMFVSIGMNQTLHYVEISVTSKVEQIHAISNIVAKNCQMKVFCKCVSF